MGRNRTSFSTTLANAWLATKAAVIRGLLAALTGDDRLTADALKNGTNNKLVTANMLAALVSAPQPITAANPVMGYNEVAAMVIGTVEIYVSSMYIASASLVGSPAQIDLPYQVAIIYGTSWFVNGVPGTPPSGVAVNGTDATKIDITGGYTADRVVIFYFPVT